MGALIFLGGALALFLIVSLISWLRFRERDAKFGSSINDFQSQMGMLDPSAKARRSRRRK
jgi:hypothetical protein